MKPDPPPSGLRHGLDFLIDPDWTPAQALAVFALLDDLRERIWAHYAAALQQQYRDDRSTRHPVPIDDPPF